MMKNIRFLTFALAIATLVLSACGTPAVTPTSTPVAVVETPRVEAMPVTFIGVVDRITDDQWVISGTTVTVDPSVVRDGPFAIGDRVKVEGLVSPDGSLTVSRVEAPPATAADNTNDAASNTNTNDANGNEGNINASNSNDSNTNDDNSNASNSNDSNVNDDNGDDNTNDDNSNDSNSNDDNGGNSNDDNDNDDNSGRDDGDDDDDSNSNDD